MICHLVFVADRFIETCSGQNWCSTGNSLKLPSTFVSVSIFNGSLTDKGTDQAWLTLIQRTGSCIRF